MFGGSQKLSSMFVMQKSQHCQLSLGGDKWKGNFNKLMFLLKPLTFSACEGESSRQKGAKKRKPNTFSKHDKRKIKPKPQNSNPKRGYLSLLWEERICEG